MSSPDRRTERILATLDERVAKVEKYFKNMCRLSPLTRLLGGRCGWAIMGGAVRDALLADRLAADTVRMFLPDIDVAVASDLCDLPMVTDPRVRVDVAIESNHFGGLKAVVPDLGEVDLWTWGSAGRPDLDEWRERLGRIDLGLNATAFVWPQGKLIVHPQWREDLSHRRVELLSEKTVRREWRPVRAVALAVKLERSTGIPFSLGENLLGELDWLRSEERNSEVPEALHYLHEKVREGRWSREVIRRLNEECQALASKLTGLA
jgi:hypothetical protein